MEKYLVAIALSIILLSIAIAYAPNYVHASSPLISRVQGPAQGTTTSNALSATMSQTPQVGDVVIAVIGIESTGSNQPFITPQITQTGVTWLSSGSETTVNSSTGFNSIQIRAGIVNTASASTTITIALNANYGTVSVINATADVCEYSGLDTAYIQNHFTDGFNGNSFKNSPVDTDATAQTTYANELWIGATLLTGYSQSSPTGGFTLLDGSVNNGFSVGYLENIVSSTGQAEATTSFSGSNGRWYAVIGTFPAAPSITLTPLSSPTDTEITVSGSGFAVNSPMTATFDGATLPLSGTTTTDSTGSFTATFTVPTTATSGDHTFTAKDNQATSVSASFTVTPNFALPEGPLGALGAVLAFAAAFIVWTKKKHAKN